MAKNQRLGRNSTDNVVALAAGVSTDVPVPSGVHLRTDDEVVIWRQLTQTRAHADWREFDLLLVAKMVRAEAEIRKCQAQLDKLGMIIKSDRGTPIVNPYISIMDTLQRQQLAIVRSMSMTQTERDPRTMNGAGKRQGELRRTFANDDDFLAKP